MGIESFEQIEQSPEELSIGTRVENVTCDRQPDGEYLGFDEQGHAFIIPPGAGSENEKFTFTGAVEVIDTAEDREGNVRYIARYIPE